MSQRRFGRKATLIVGGKQETVVVLPRKSATAPWTRLFYEIFGKLAGEPEASPQLRVLAALLASVDWQGENLLVDASAKELAAKAQMPLSTLYQTAASLEKLGLLIRRPKPWRLSPYFFYHGAGTGYKKAMDKHRLRLVKS